MAGESCAYPRHLYVFTKDAMLAETLRERYGVPVEWGADTERLRRMLPREARKDEETSLRETLLVSQHREFLGSTDKSFGTYRYRDRDRHPTEREC